MVTELMIASHFPLISAPKIEGERRLDEFGPQSHLVRDRNADVVVVSDRLAELDGDLRWVPHIGAVGQPAGLDEPRGRHHRRCARAVVTRGAATRGLTPRAARHRTMTWLSRRCDACPWGARVGGGGPRVLAGGFAPP